MNTVECPKCALRFEPASEVVSNPASQIFCPQCGNCFMASADHGSKVHPPLTKTA